MTVRLLARRIAVAPGIEVASEWAVPGPWTNGTGVVLAHGAGNDMTHPFIGFIQQGLADAGLLSVRFNFPYKESGSKAPDRPAVLQQTWQAVIDAVRNDEALAPQRLFIGGKSMGGRIASLMAVQDGVCDGLVFLGYPLHPAGRPQRLRTGHWPEIRCPALFVAGTRDPLCDLDLLRAELGKLGSSATVRVIHQGDHSFKVPTALNRSQTAVWSEILGMILEWTRRQPEVGGVTTRGASPTVPDRAPDSAR
ncbi:alpha/beta hydrolase family protein [Methylotetracoccus oryzae]|uniref:alpha/beta hydrolase family protein n=1 Tax=Methylotetracoccus oryzae TaxID=1919059 RepID=UPI001118036C|nr:alpha/beta family hydrolase [Methylotetracoccus oryzae]